MQASIYRLRQRGIKLPRPQQFVAGRLLMNQGLDPANRATLKAQLLSDQGALLLPTLNGAQVRRITESGIVITGTEVIPRRSGAKASADFWPQTWWCLIITAGLGAEILGEMTLEYEAMTAPPAMRLPL